MSPAGAASRAAVVLAATLLAAGALSGCTRSSKADGDGDPVLVASFYPLQWVTEQVSGSAVTSLTKPGAEPHDLELAPRDVAAVADADLVVYLAGFQPAVDDAVVEADAQDATLDVRATARLDRTYSPIEGGRQDGKGAVDPHFWLDPLRLADVADAVAARLAVVRPADASTYEANATRVRGALTTLDTDYRTGLAHCADKDLVTSHNAFGYLAARYGLTQVGITGLTAEDEPAPADLARVADFVSAHGVRTIYSETLASPAVARTVAAETGATTAVLDPIEGLTDASAGTDYLAVMRSNLASIEKGQPCS